MNVARKTPVRATSAPRRSNRNRARLRRCGPAALVLATGGLLTWVACTVTSNLEQARLRSEFGRFARERESAIVDGIEDNLRALYALSARYDDSDGVDRSEFKSFATLILLGNMGIQALEWVPRVPDAEREQYEQMARRDGLTTFQIAERDPNGGLTPAARRDEYFPIFYVEPLRGNEEALGFDLASSAPRAAALAEARDSGQMVATPPITLVQEKGNQYGTLVFIPWYRPAAPLDTVEQRRVALVGFVLGVYRLSDLLEACVAALPPAGIDIWLTDRTTPAREQILSYHASRTRPQGSAGSSTNPGATTSISFETSVTVGGRAWILKSVPAPAFYASRPHTYLWIVLAAGLLCTLLLTAYTWQAAGHTQHVERQVAERTRALVEANSALSREMAERKRAEEVLHTHFEQIERERVNLQAVFDSAQVGFLLLNEQTEVIRVNDATARLVGKDSAQMVGHQPGDGLCCIHATTAPNGCGTGAACPQCPIRLCLTRVLGTGEPVRGMEVNQVLQINGEPRPLWLSISATLVKLNDLRHVLVAISDITERKRAEESLVEVKTAVDLSMNGIATADLNGNVRFANPAWARMHGYSVDEVIGRHWSIFHTREQLELEVNPFVAQFLEASSGEREIGHVRRDGTTFPTWMSCTVLRDANQKPIGLIATAVDITARRRADEALRQNEERFRLAAQSITNMIWEWDLVTGRLDWFGDIEGLLGYAPGEFPHTIGAWEALVDPEDHDRVMAALDRHSKGDAPYDEEYRVRRKDGGVCHWHARATAIRDVQGKAIRMFGAIEDVTERKRAETERGKLLVRQQGISQVQASLLAPAPLEAKLKSVTNGIVHLFEADFCRIWLIRPGDLCERGCLHAQVHEGPHVCRFRNRCLHLLASSGRYTHVDGPGHRRVPFGCYKIGRVVADEERGFLTNDVQTDPRVHNHGWARELGLVSFAGYRLRAPGGETLGVLALFAKHPLSADEDAMLDGLGSTVALTIQQATAEGALRESEAHLRAITDSAQDAIISTDSEGRVGFWNPAAERIFGYTASEAVGRNVLDLAMLPQEQEAERRNLAEIARTGTAPLVGKILEHSALRKDGSQFPSEVSISTYRDIEGVRVIAVVRDVTDRKQAETKLEALHRQLLDASRQAGMAEVAAGVLHNVGNVLNSLNVSAMLVADKVRASRVARLAQVADLLRAHIDDLGAFVTVDEKGRQLPNYVLQLAEHLTSDQSAILGELDGLTKNVEHIKSIINMQQGYARNVSLVEPVALAGLLDEVLKMNAASFEHHGLTVVCDYADAPVVTVDKHMVLQVLVNLIRNAKHALRDSGRPDKRLTVRAARDGDEFVRIEVCDNGVGIAAEDLTRIWEYGFTTKKDGNGVGLHNSALAAKAIGGSLGAHSDGPGQGATFVFEIPMRVGESAHV